MCLVNNAATVDVVGTFGQLATGESGAALAVNLAAPVALADLFCVSLPMRICRREGMSVLLILRAARIMCRTVLG